MSDVIVDASALLALPNGEHEAETVARYLPGVIMNTVNLSEVIAKLAEYGMPEEAIRSSVSLLGLKVVPFDFDLSFATGLLRPATKPGGLSLGDRACLATGLLMKLPVLTADKIWTALGMPLNIISIRE